MNARPLTPRLNNAIALAQRVAKKYKKPYVGTEDMAIALIEAGGAVSELLKKKGVTENEILEAIGVK